MAPKKPKTVEPAPKKPKTVEPDETMPIVEPSLPSATPSPSGGRTCHVCGNVTLEEICPVDGNKAEATGE